MQHNQVPDDLRDLAFEFFYWFSRFEFALKECEYLKDSEVGAKAEPGWDVFINELENSYTVTPAANKLIEFNPQRQVVGQGKLSFRDVGFNDKPSDLGKVVRLAKTVRNNLFHGGKYGADSWDDPDRMRVLLPLVVTVLDELAEHAGIEADYRRTY